MPQTRVKVARFIGGTSLLISPQASRERTFNLFPETTRSGGKVPNYLRPAEGIAPFAQATTTDSSCLFYQDGQCFGAIGTAFVELFSNGSTVVRGTIAYDGSQASIVSNGTAGNQIVVCSANRVYVWNVVTMVFAEVTIFPDNGIPIAQIEFMDGYVFALYRNTRRVYYSSLEDATSWDITFGYFERSWGSDNIAAIKRSGRQLWLIGTDTTEIWADNGNATQPFAPIQGAFLDIGSSAGPTVVRDGFSIDWLARDERGGAQVVRASGYAPQEVSTYAIDTMIAAGDLSMAEAFVHQLGGHQFYWLYVPGLDTTPVYDLAENEWSERAMWDFENGVYTPHVARCHCYAFQKHLIGTRDSGTIYQMSTDFLTNGFNP